ncbi:MAG TPA: ATP-binding protein [Vicinamibacteria bacterium]|nr:ATP-binding protein [Vicinamibacteria bacterium]
MPRQREKDQSVEEGRVRVHDPFELIRWLALSQPDPKKALAELVQNSLDARARHIRISRVREKKLPCLKILDDGEGVIPEIEDRREALRYIATHIGHSRKRSLSPEERLALMTQGRYGIGLLGFWCLGRILEIRTSLPGQKPYRLVLYRNEPHFKIEPLRGKLVFDDRFTEVVVVDLDRDSSTALSGRRAADYLASELRGQLLARSVEVVIEDKMSRGRSPKTLRVRPPRFLGERLEGLETIEVPGHAPVRLELYLTGVDPESDGSVPVALYAAGTVVTDDFMQLSAIDLDHPPWTDPRLTGMVDFPELSVAPGSRRGVIPDEVSHAFAEALRRIEPLVMGILETKERERAEQLDQNAVRDLKRAFRDFYRKRPRYSMLPMQKKSVEGMGDSSAGAGVSTDTEEAVESSLQPSGAEPSELFPPGPLSAVEIVPKNLVVESNTERNVRAKAFDDTGRQILEGIDYSWDVWGRVGSLREEGARAVFVAGENPTDGILSVTAREPLTRMELSAAVPVEVVETLPTSGDEGIPEPELIDATGASWRSRFHEDRWQVNTGHPDYRASTAKPALKLRYLATLFAKEVVLRSSQDRRFEEPLEQMVEVSAYADRQLTERPPRGRRRKPT